MLRVPPWTERVPQVCLSCTRLLMETREIRRFGRYEIVAELGRGAMGVVYKARDPQIDREVALKTVSLLGQEPDQDQEYRTRFLYEAQAAGRLQHPGIVAIYDVGEDPEKHDPYIVLEYVTGESLNRVLSREKKLALPTALRLAEEIADALDYAHAQGVVHRDIKPANILITEDGHAKIADFGIAKLNLAHYTLPGRVLGTPAYMAPEQLAGEGVDGRSDLFSLGVILYAMVTGHSPFHGNSATTVCFKVVNRDPVPASAFDLDLPRALDAVISHAIAKDPDERYQRGSDFASDLRQLRQQYQPGSTTTSLHALIPGSSTLKAFSKLSSSATSSGPVRREQLPGAATHRAPLRELIVAAALVVILIIVVGFPSKQSGTLHKTLVDGQSTAATDPNIPNPQDASSRQQNAARQPSMPAPPKADRGDEPKSPSTTKSPIAGMSPSNRPSKRAKVPPASLQLAVQHQFKQATLSLWIDDKLALSRPLHGGVQKHLIVFNAVHGTNSETVQVPAGSHIIRLRAQSADLSIDLAKTISADFTGGDDKTLQVTFNKRNTTMNLIWQ